MVVVSVVADQGRGFSLGAALVPQKPITRDVLTKGLERLGLVADAQRDIVGKAEFKHGRFIGEVERALSRVG